MKLTDLSPAEGSKRKKRRIGRGNGSNRGTTAGKGSKGQRARSGSKRRAWFEGGQMPLLRRVPKRGFTNKFRTVYSIINVGQLNDFDEGTEVTPALLRQAGILPKADRPVKILSDGELSKKLTIKAHKTSARALEKIQAAGGAFVALVEEKVEAPSARKAAASKEEKAQSSEEKTE
jgi:large subunit ribosomal protein L15